MNTRFKQTTGFILSSLIFFTIALSGVTHAETMVKAEPDTHPQSASPPAKTMPVPAAPKDVKKIDKDGDGKISFDEFFEDQELQNKQRIQHEIKRMMAQCDKNKDGSISIDELASDEDRDKYLDPMAFAAIDENERREIYKRCMFPKEAMDFLDLDGNGSVSRDEMLVSISNDRPSKKMERKLEKRMQKREAKRKRKEFVNCDSNGDQLLSLREAVSMKCNIHMFTEQFDAYDKNRDQLLTLEEITADIKPVEFRPPGMPSEAELRKKMSPLMRLETSMYECDKDDDGRLGKNETIDARCEQDMVFFDTVDHNQDGYVSQNELQRMRLKKRFERMDKNHNGYLEASETHRIAVGFMP